MRKAGEICLLPRRDFEVVPLYGQANTANRTNQTHTGSILDMASTVAPTTVSDEIVHVFPQKP